MLLPDEQGRRILLTAGSDGWTLPSFRSNNHHVGNAELISRFVRDQFGACVSYLRSHGHRYDVATGQRTLYCETEQYGPGWELPAGAVWVGPDDLNNYAMDTEQAAVVRHWFTGVSPGRAAWTRRGWHRQAEAWVQDRLSAQGDSLVAALAPMRAWDRCSLMRAGTQTGEVYFKAVPPMFGYEPLLADWLARFRPGVVPDVLAVQPEAGWYLMRGFAGQVLHERADLSEWERALSAYAELQMALAAEVPALVALGCPQRGLSVLANQGAALLGDRAVLGQHPAPALFPEPVQLGPDQVAQLEQAAQKLPLLTQELAAYGLPETLDHGDFWTGNLFVTDSGVRFIDWSDAAVTHPFFSMSLFLDYHEQEPWPPARPEVWRRLRDAYLEPWTVRAPAPQLRQAFGLAYQLGFLHAALTYHGYVLPHMEARWEMAEMVPWLLGRFLAAAER